MNGISGRKLVRRGLNTTSRAAPLPPPTSPQASSLQEPFLWRQFSSPVCGDSTFNSSSTRSHAIDNCFATAVMRSGCWHSQMSALRSAWILTWVLQLALWLTMAQGMRTDQVKELR